MFKDKIHQTNTKIHTTLTCQASETISSQSTIKKNTKQYDLVNFSEPGARDRLQILCEYFY